MPLMEQTGVEGMSRTLPFEDAITAGRNMWQGDTLVGSAFFMCRGGVERLSSRPLPAHLPFLYTSAVFHDCTVFSTLVLSLSTFQVPIIVLIIAALH